MKKILLIAVVLFQLKSYGQAVPNGTFENWNSVPYDKPSGWNNGNVRDIQRMGTASVSKVTGFSGWAIRIQTNIVGSDTSDSFIINTNNPCNDPPQWTGGVPYSQQPTAITGYYRYNLPGNDSALLVVIFRKNGVHIGDNFMMIKGSGSQPTFAPFSFPVTCSGTPDTMIIAATSSNKMTNAGVQNGSFLELDNLAFAGTTQAIPDGGFENWIAKNYDVPSGWETWGDGAGKTASSYAGISAVRLETIGGMCGGLNPSGITTGHMTNNNGPAGGYPYTLTNDTLYGYYKYTPAGIDTAGIYVALTKNGLPVGGAYQWLTAASNYTYFEFPFQAGFVPDTIRVDAQSSGWNLTQANQGSVLYIDNLQVKSQSLGIIENGLPFVQSFVYPNPVHDMINIQLRNKLEGAVTWTLYDITGKVISEETIHNSGSLFKIPAKNIEPGMYFYEIKSNTGIARNKIVKE